MKKAKITKLVSIISAIAIAKLNTVEQSPIKKL